MNRNNIDKKYQIPVAYISCPGCGKRYGHHNTKVDSIIQECSTCVKDQGKDKDANYLQADVFIENIVLPTL